MRLKKKLKSAVLHQKKTYEENLYCYKKSLSFYCKLILDFKIF